MLLKTWFDRGFDLVDVAHGFFDFATRFAVEQSDARTGTSGVAC